VSFYHGIFSACCFFSTVRHRRGIASGATPLLHPDSSYLFLALLFHPLVRLGPDVGDGGHAHRPRHCRAAGFGAAEAAYRMRGERRGLSMAPDLSVSVLGELFSNLPFQLNRNGAKRKEENDVWCFPMA
jgi:hypothetical protein